MSNKDKRYNVHFKISTMPNGFMVLDYEATPEMDNIYDDETHGYQMVIRDVSRAEAKRICDLLNEKEDEIKKLSLNFEEYKEDVSDILFENIGLFNTDLINQIDKELGINLCDRFEEYIKNY